jgi:YtxH-like protein
MNAMIKDLKLEDVLEHLRARSSRRIEQLMSEGRRQARHASGGHETTTLFSAFTIGILAGAIVGAAIALLITPLSGKQAREKLSERVDKLRSDNSDKVNWDEVPSASGNGKAAASYEPDYTAPKPLS